MKKRERGFTLIELLVVIAILGVLSGIAVPRVLTSLTEARNQANQANMAMLQSALERIAIDQSISTLVGWNTALGGTFVLDTARDIDAVMQTNLGPYISKFPRHPISGRVYTITVTNVTIGTATVAVATVADRGP